MTLFLRSVLVVPGLVVLLVFSSISASTATESRSTPDGPLSAGAMMGADGSDVSAVPGLAVMADTARPRQGLHYSAEELRVWRQRSGGGPFRSGGDAYDNSPGDWQRIVANKDAFLAAPGNGRWSPNWGSGPIPTTTGERTYVPDADYTTRVRDAAFYALVTDDAGTGRAVIAELGAQARERNADLGDRVRFPAGQGRVSDTNPYFMTAAALTTLLFAADYVKHWASPTEFAALRQWHRDGAAWLLPDMRERVENRFPGRDRGDYSPRLSPNDGKIGFLGGPSTTIFGRVYNNREAVMWLYMGLVGLDQGDAELREQSKMWFKEWVMFAVYPASGSYGGRSWSGGGWLAEMERFGGAGSVTSDLGWSYATNTLNVVGMMADHFARAGDPSLYDFETRAGLYGTAARPDQEPKSLLFALRAMSRHTNGEIGRYGTTEAGQANGDYLADGFNPVTGWEGVQDVAYTVMNLYYQDPFLRQAYLRRGPGFRPHPRNPAPNARGAAWQGHWGMYPGVLFQAGMLEGAIDPYGRERSPGPRQPAAPEAPGGGPNSTPGQPAASDETRVSSTVIERD